MMSNRTWIVARVAVACFLAQTLAAAPLAAQEDARALYRAGRQAIREDEYREAARLYRQLIERYRDTEYAPDAYYWQAFSLYRLGETENLRQSIEVLKQLRATYPDASIEGDADELTARIYGELARRGDSEAARWLDRQTTNLERIYIVGSKDDEYYVVIEEDRDENDIRIAALQALTRMNPDRALPIVRKVLERRDEDSEKLRMEAVFLLAEIEDPEARRLIVQTLRGDPSLRVRREAVLWLMSARAGESAEALEVLEDLIWNSEDREMRRNAVMALAHSENREALAILKRAALDDDLSRELRSEAIMALTTEESPETAGFLQNLYDHLEEPQLKEHVVLAMSHYDDPSVRRWFYELVFDETEALDSRRVALHNVLEGGHLPTHEVIELYDRITHRSMRESLIYALGERGDREALEKLLEIARSGDDSDLRSQAIYAIGMSDNKDAADVLERLITEE